MNIYPLLLIAASGAGARTADDTSYLGIFAETTLMRIAGVKPKPMPKLPPGIKLPESVRAMMSMEPTRKLTIRLFTPSIAPDNATATVQPPPGLKLGDKLDLDLFRPQPPTPPKEGDTSKPTTGGDKLQDFTIKIYWGSSDTVQPGQPKVISLSSLGIEQKMEMMARMRQMSPSSPTSYYYKENWTTGYWPSKNQPGEIQKDASLTGTFNLTTSYAGNVSIDAPEGVDFMPAFELSSPDLGTRPSMDGALPFQWAAMPTAIGIYASAVGMEGQNTIIIWTSSDSFSEQSMGNSGFLSGTEVRARVASHHFMPGDATSFTIPAGIFKDAGFAMISMVGYGPGNARDGVNPLPRIQTKTSLQVMMGTPKSPPRGAN
ncbi:MAG TPA: hypothetical protein VKT78_18210 [Fimbriimonadaceae bacterium]|nr:hypothetical protein [Fimbriimonadaceae bacterium]